MRARLCRHQLCRAAVGFLNPTLYSIAVGSNYSSNFHDVASGNNDYLGKPQQPYFYALPGYDLVTGWGSPAGQALIDSLAPWGHAGYQLAASTTSLSISPGSSGTSAMTVTPQPGFTGSVSIAVTSALPSGVTPAFVPNAPNGSGVLTLTASNSAPYGNYLVLIAATSGTRVVTTTLGLSMTAPTTTVLSANPTGGSLNSERIYTLTAAVASGTDAVQQGEVEFCDASSTYCTDSHLLGTE